MMQRRRKNNLHQPDHDDANRSVERVIDAARAIATDDHRGTFASKRERDLIATVYLRRALHELGDKLG
jgi:hypothetical protein